RTTIPKPFRFIFPSPPSPGLHPVLFCAERVDARPAGAWGGHRRSLALLSTSFRIAERYEPVVQDRLKDRSHVLPPELAKSAADEGQVDRRGDCDPPLLGKIKLCCKLPSALLDTF